MNADDILIAVVIAIAIIITGFYFRYRLSRAALQGYWATSDGKQYTIRVFGGGEITVEGPSLQARGRIRPLRSVCIGDGEKTVCGSVDLDGRVLSWADGVIWVRQGLLGRVGP